MQSLVRRQRIRIAKTDYKTMATDLKTDAQRAYDEHCQFEDQLINYRLTWMLASEALLFAGFGAIMSSDKVGQDKIDFLTYVFIIVGLSLAGLTFVSVLAAVVANVTYWFRLRKKKKKYEKLRLGVWGATTITAWIVACLIPVVFAVGWLLIWIYT
jgi:hypothetical protein